MDSMQDAIREKGLELFGLMEAGRPDIFDTGRWTGKLMDLAMKDPALKVRLFRFVDVLPTLSRPEQVVEHIREYFLDGGVPVPDLLRRLMGRLDSGLATSIAAQVVRRNITALSRTFMAGESPEKALPTLEKIWRQGGAFTIDILGETALSEQEAKEYQDAYLRLMNVLARAMAGWPPLDSQRENTFPRLNISVKLSSLYSRIGPVNYDDSVARSRERLRPLFQAARQSGAFINLDMEMQSLKEITLDAFRSLMDEAEFRDWSGAGIALQAYLTDARDDLQQIIEWSKKGGRRITVRLVKGAYWEYEAVTARQKGWRVPVFAEKSHTDWNFEQCAALMLANSAAIIPAIATHNVRSLAAALVAAERHGVGPDDFEFQMLYGMAGPVKAALQKTGYVVREYAPVGSLIPGMAYLVRRLLENTSNEGFLRRTFSTGVSREALLEAPAPCPDAVPPTARSGIGPFVNEPLRDFCRREQRDQMQSALDKVRTELGRDYPAVVAGREQSSGAMIVSINPARPTEVIGRVAAVDREPALEAVAVARKALPLWAGMSPADRAGILFRGAGLIRARKAELAAWQILETGKNWPEADADVVEAIDYLEYYGREMLRLGKPLSMGEIPGEENRYFYCPRGVALVIAPWNFPLAISAGMVSAALVAGNTVLYKPSSLSAVTGWQLFSLFREAGVPDGVLNFVPGNGDRIGGLLAGHPEVDVIAFTGSREVGLGLMEQAARSALGQRSVKRVIAEMGGKNAVIVDTDADLDQAVAGVLQSAFGYQGQKCSACSRVIVLAGCYDRFLERLAAAVSSIVVGPPEDPACFMGPLIEDRARQRVEQYIAMGRSSGRIVAQAPAPGEGFYAPPTVIADLPPDSPLLRDEIFGPVLTVIRAASMEEALGIAIDSDYALTGGLFSRSPGVIEKVAREFAVGNLYINRGITGAVVGRQPFGGFRLSGIGSKAGGPDYLAQFMVPRVVTENTMRRGFSPELFMGPAD